MISSSHLEFKTAKALSLANPKLIRDAINVLIKIIAEHGQAANTLNVPRILAKLTKNCFRRSFVQSNTVNTQVQKKKTNFL